MGAGNYKSDGKNSVSGAQNGGQARCDTMPNTTDTTAPYSHTGADSNPAATGTAQVDNQNGGATAQASGTGTVVSGASTTANGGALVVAVSGGSSMCLTIKAGSHRSGTPSFAHCRKTEVPASSESQPATADVPDTGRPTLPAGPTTSTGATFTPRKDGDGNDMPPTAGTPFTASIHWRGTSRERPFTVRAGETWCLAVKRAWHTLLRDIPSPPPKGATAASKIKISCPTPNEVRVDGPSPLGLDLSGVTVPAGNLDDVAPTGIPEFSE